MIKKVNLILVYSLIYVTSFVTPVFAERQSVSEVDIDCDSVFNSALIGYLKKFWRIMIIIAPIILIVMTLVDILKAISLADDSGFKKIINTFIRRFVAVAALILLPIILNFVLGLINENFSTCI